jgi:hypothetical protein
MCDFVVADLAVVDFFVAEGAFAVSFALAAAVVPVLPCALVTGWAFAPTASVANATASPSLHVVNRII